MADQEYNNNQTNYPMQQGYGLPADGQPAYGQQGYGQYPPQQVVPVQKQPQVVVVKEKRSRGTDGNAVRCCAGACAALMACLCCCFLASKGGGRRGHRGRF